MGKPEFVFRTYRKGDEEGIAKCLTTCFKTFADFGMTGEKWLKIPEYDPGFKYETALLAEKKNQIVGHIQLTFREIKIGDDTFVRTGGIANVSILPEFRRKGVATALLAMADDVSRKYDALMNGLGADYQGDAWRVYKRAGYVDVGFSKDVKISIERAYEALKGLKPQGKTVELRNYVEGDEEKLLNVYMSCVKPYRGVVKRDLEYWVKRYSKVLAYDSFFYVPFSPKNVLMAKENGEVVGYALICKLGETGRIIELFALPNRIKALKSLSRVAVESLDATGVKLLAFHLPEDSLTHKVFKEFGEESEGGVYMFKVLNMPGVLGPLASEFSDRLRKDPEASKVKGLMQIKTDVGSAALNILDGEVKSARGGFSKPDTVVETTHECFVKMLFGQVSVSEAVSGGKIKITSSTVPRVVRVLELMFPQRTWFICPGDTW